MGRRRPAGRRRSFTQPRRRLREQVLADREAAVKHVTEQLLPVQDAPEGHLLTSADREAPLWRVRRGWERVDGGHFERQVEAGDAGQLEVQLQKIGAFREGRERPGEGDREVEAVRRLGIVWELDDDVLKRQQHARVHLECEVEVEGAAAALFGMEVDLPGLAQRIALYEVPLVVHVEAVIDGVALQISDVPGDVDDCHRSKVRAVGGCHYACRVDEAVVEALDEAVAAVRAALGALEDWGLAGTRAGQYRSDLTADEAAIAVLDRHGLGVLSEESGLHGEDREIVVVLDPVDGSTNASRGIPWYAASLCAVDAGGPGVALVVNLASGTRYDAVRGGGARRDGQPIRPTDCASMNGAIVGLSGYPTRSLGWKQYRALGAAALDLCAVADGRLDAYADCSRNAHGAWDYLGGALVCTEAGAVVVDALDRDLVALGHADRRTPLAAATPTLLAELKDRRAEL